MVVMSDEDEKVEENELEAFVASTLIAITNGVTSAQEKAAKSAFKTGEYRYSPPKEIAFDIAVNAKRNREGKGGFKIQILDVGLDAGGTKGSEHSTVSRVQFTIVNKFKKSGNLASSTDSKTESEEFEDE
jgi:hypothetical protein